MGLIMAWDERRLSRCLTLRDLNVLMTAVKCGSMGKAAAELSISQPAISKAIADMEQSLGVRLLDRGTRGVEATIYARALLEHSAIAFDELKQAAQHIEFIAHPTSGELRVGSTIAIATGFISAVLDRLSRRYPRISFHISAGEASSIYRALEERRFDLVIVPILASPIKEHLHADILYDEPLVVVAGARSPWSRRRKVELAELMDATWALPSSDSLYGSVVAEAFHDHGLGLPRATVLTPVAPLRNALVATGRFLSIVQASALKYGLSDRRIKILPINMSTTRRPIGIITLKNRTLSPVAKLFIDAARGVAKAPRARQSVRPSG
jgi:DNA-binding transcriptional LysR family regulator